MNSVYRAALELQDFCQTRGWRFCFIGGLAIKPRLRALLARHAMS